MTDRERFLATMSYQPCDRGVIADFSFWDETLPAWHRQGLPGWVNRRNADEFFGMDRYAGWLGLKVGLQPSFPHEILEDHGDQEVFQDSNGVRLLRHKTMSSIPVHLGHTLVDRKSWETHFKPRLDPDHPERTPDWDRVRRISEDDAYPLPRVIEGGSLYGWIRNWMGLEAVSYLVHDDLLLFEEMVTTIADCVVEVHRRAFAHGVRADACSMWEDMCYSSGPLLGVEHFKKILVPHYRRITAQLQANGCRFVWLDCDGCIDHLTPHWLDAGVNIMFPLEVGTWGADPIAFRRRYGKDCLLMGGFDKHILARSRRAIEDEVIRLAPLVEEGGFIGFCDHRVPPDVPYAHYLFYLDRVRHYWGRDIDLQPMHSAALEQLRRSG